MDMDWYQHTAPLDVDIPFNGGVEYPITTLTKPGGARIQIICDGGQWMPVILDKNDYRPLTEAEHTEDVQASVDWAYDQCLPPEEVLVEVGGVENGYPGAESQPE